MNFAKYKKQILEVLVRYPISKAAVFGSFARGSATHSSDIDLLIETSAPVSLFMILKLENELQKLTRHKIDIVEYSAIKPSLRENILREAVSLL